jgi:hypothetical protein
MLLDGDESIEWPRSHGIDERPSRPTRIEKDLAIPGRPALPSYCTLAAWALSWSASAATSAGIR